MPQRAIPYLFLRGGTSRGPYFLRDDLPADEATLSRVLVRALGAGHTLNIDGIGGGAAVTTKVAMLSPGSDGWADVDYFFAQVAVEDALVDYRPSCGNILSGVGPAALESGLVQPSGDTTRVRIHAVNTGARVEAIVATPGGLVEYNGNERIDGVPGTASPIPLHFMDVAGSVCGALLPTGHARERINGIDVTCMDVAMPMVIARAVDFGLSGYESREELDANKEFFARMEAIRTEAGTRMGLGDVSRSVTPKFGLLAPPRSEGTIATRYFMPWSCHPTMAVTGGQCLATAVLHPGTVADGVARRPEGSPARVRLEHPAGSMDVTATYTFADGRFELASAGILRTARLLARGELMVPASAWNDA